MTGMSRMMKETLKDKTIRLYGEGYSAKEITKMLNANRDSVHTILSRYRPKLKALNYVEPAYEENVTLATINRIFNSNPIIKSPNRMAAF